MVLRLAKRNGSEVFDFVFWWCARVGRSGGDGVDEDEGKAGAYYIGGMGIRGWRK